MSETVLLPDRSQSFQLGGTGVIFKLKGEQTNGRVSLVEHTVAPGVLAAPLHTHRDEDEISYILEGDLTFLVGNRIIHAIAGTIVVKPRGAPHTFWNAGATPARLLEIITPAGFEQYFQELALLVASGGPPDPIRRIEIYKKYHLTVDRTASEALLHNYSLGW